MAPDLEEQARRLALLTEGVRRELYLYVAASDEPVSREAVARAVGVGRSLAAHHLDRLAEDGLLAVEYRRLTGRTGPGAGRPAKLYRRADTQVTVNLPARSYELASRLLADAVEQGSRGGDPAAALRERARAYGRQLGQDVSDRRGGPADSAVPEAALDALAGEGYEPKAIGEGLVLRNCPFHALVGEHRTLVCRMNLALLEGFVEGLGPGASTWQPVLDPGEQHCCVRLRTTEPPGQ